MSREILIKDTHRGLWYEDGVLERILTAGRYVIPRYLDLGFWRRKRVEVVRVDVRERELTIKGQEILTADKVAIRVSILVHFRVTDPTAAIHNVENYEDRLYGDVQLAARRSLASMSLEEILTARTRLSEDISRDVTEAAAGYGVAILRADVKDIVFPGNVQEVMNRVLMAERESQAQLVEARTAQEKARLELETRSRARRSQADDDAVAARLEAESRANAVRVEAEAAALALAAEERGAEACAKNPALLRLRELEVYRSLAGAPNARLYVGLDAPLRLGVGEELDRSKDSKRDGA